MDKMWHVYKTGVQNNISFINHLISYDFLENACVYFSIITHVHEKKICFLIWKMISAIQGNTVKSLNAKVSVKKKYPE